MGLLFFELLLFLASDHASPRACRCSSFSSACWTRLLCASSGRTRSKVPRCDILHSYLVLHCGHASQGIKTFIVMYEPPLSVQAEQQEMCSSLSLLTADRNQLAEQVAGEQVICPFWSQVVRLQDTVSRLLLGSISLKQRCTLICYPHLPSAKASLINPPAGFSCHQAAGAGGSPG